MLAAYRIVGPQQAPESPVPRHRGRRLFAGCFRVLCRHCRLAQYLALGARLGEAAAFVTALVLELVRFHGYNSVLFD